MKKFKPSPQPKYETATGIFSATASGFGFVSRGSGKPDVFIPVRAVANALDGDKVTVEIIDPRGHNNLGPVGRIAGILSRGRRFVVGELLHGRLLKPLDSRFNGTIRITGSVKGIQVGEWVKVRLLENGAKFTEALKGTIEERYGMAGKIAADLQAVVAEYDLCKPYTEEDNRAAARIQPAEIARTDLTRHFSLTIDPADAKDFDDAISILPGDKKGESILGVHIADVAAWVHAGTKLDKEASRRGFSSYLPGMFLPMLPGALTALISLREGVDSNAHTILFTIRESDGKILGSKRLHSTIRVAARLNYDEVQTFLEDPKSAPKKWSATLKKNLTALAGLVRKMRRNRRQTEHFLGIETTEVRVLCDSATLEITGLERKVQREADQLVEECMLAANSAVAGELIERRIPGIFRVHQEPDPEKLAEYSMLMENLFHLPTGDLTERANSEHFLENLPDDHRKPVILSYFLRSLPRACYSSEPALHYGLGKYRYTHFTSPIRRYPDLLVHRQLWALDSGGKGLKSKAFLEEAALNCSAQEERNDNAYFAANDRLKLHYLHRADTPDNELPPVYEAVITRTAPAGLLCEIIELGLYGFVPASKLAGSMQYRKRSRRLKATRGHSQYKSGDIIFLVLDSLDFARGRAVFRPA
ncbi:MAG: Ribonuclease R [Lentisphaerae bacterium ADurb.Bin242]|nr:MAG: Ribonuclease R [Lentisphaerae bacterium ADurb.Bin242]